MALNGYFYNAMLVNGEYDRKYNADDYSNNLAAIISDGVRRSGEDDFKVSANGLTLTVRRGYAMVNGKAIRLDADYTFPAIAPPVGNFSRIDAVILRQDVSEAVRAPSLLIVTGTAASTPVAPAPTRNNTVYDIVLAHVFVAPSATSVSLTDTRPNSDICGWITTPVGYDDYFKSLDSAFERWFTEKKNTLSSVTMFKRYTWRTVLASSATAVSFNIPQYDNTGVDIIEVYVNGLLQTAGVDYTLAGNVITFGTGGGGTGTKVAGTEIVVICYKSIDGTGLGSVSDEVTELQNKVDALTKDLDNAYICNGVNDNVQITSIVTNFLNGAGEYAGVASDATLRLNIYGTFGAQAAASGSGTSDSPFEWMKIGAYNDKRVVVDFSNCSKVILPLEGSTYNVLISGGNLTVIGINMSVFCSAAGCVVSAHNGAMNLVAERCRYNIITTGRAVLSYSGTFRDCEAYISSSQDYAYCFRAQSSYNPIEVFGGKYRAYTANPTYLSAVFEIEAAQVYGTIYVYGANCPTVSVDGFTQSYCVSMATGYLYTFGLMSQLNNTTIGGKAEINGLVTLSRS